MKIESKTYLTLLKMTTKPIILIATAFLIFFSCEQNTDEIEEQEIHIQSVKVADTLFSGKEFPLELELSVSGCETYSRFEMSLFDSHSEFKVFIKNQLDENPELKCVSGIFQEKVTERITIDNRGDYHFIFNDSMLIKKVFIK